MHKNKKAKRQKNLEKKLKQRLLKLGLLTEITPPLRRENYPKDRESIPLDGRTGSKIIVDERR